METNFATKQDLLNLRHEMVSMKSELKQDIERMTIKLGTIVSLAIGVAVTLAKLFS